MSGGEEYTGERVERYASEELVVNDLPGSPFPRRPVPSREGKVTVTTKQLCLSTFAHENHSNHWFGVVRRYEGLPLRYNPISFCRVTKSEEDSQ